jgi:hypothetical protein
MKSSAISRRRRFSHPLLRLSLSRKTLWQLACRRRKSRTGWAGVRDSAEKSAKKRTSQRSTGDPAGSTGCLKGQFDGEPHRFEDNSFRGRNRGILEKPDNRSKELCLAAAESGLF